MGRKSFPRKVILENLESRRMLATINIESYGARPNDGGDDTGAIRAAINASRAGDTVVFGDGTYNVGATIELKGGRRYTGEAGTIVKGKPENHIFEIHEHGITLENMTLDGKPIFIDRDGGLMVENLLINNLVLNVRASGEGNNGITYTTGLRDSTISNSTFNLITCDNGIYGYNWDNLKIANNAFISGNEGMHLVDFRDNSVDLLIEQNYISGIRRMGIEIQGGGHNTIIQDNYLEKPTLTANRDDNRENFAYSIIADMSSGSIVRRNTAIVPERPDGKGVRYIFEIGGDNTLVEENYTVGGNHVLSVNDFNGTTSTLAKNNLFIGYLQGPSGRNLTQQNNGANVTLSWNINRGKPGPNKRLDLNGYVGSTAPTPPPPPTPVPPTTPKPPTPAPEPEPDTTPGPIMTPNGSGYLSDRSWAFGRNGWGSVERDQSNGETATDDGKTLTLNGKTYAKGLGVHADSELRYLLDGEYSRFTADIGIDDEVGDKGNVIFQVWADGVKLFDSGAMTGSSTIRRVDVDVAGKQELKLLVLANGSRDYDHANWADARLTNAFAYLSDITPTFASNGWGQFEADRSNGETGSDDGDVITLNGVEYTKGLGVHAEADLRYEIGDYKRFTADIGVDDYVGSNGSITFQVWADDEKLYDSGVMTGASSTKKVDVDIAGHEELRLVVLHNGGAANDHGNWADAKLQM